MAEARGRLGWGQTAGVMWLLAEANRDRKKQSAPFTPDTFNPYRPRERRAKADFSAPAKTVLKGMLGKGYRTRKIQARKREG